RLPPIEGFACSLAGPRTVSLTWPPAPTYDADEVLGTGVRIAKLGGAASSYLDALAPIGALRYQLIPIESEIHRGPPAVCEVVVPPEGAQFVRGRVSWAGGGPVRVGTVRVLDPLGREEVARAQVTVEGTFSVPVPKTGPYLVRYEGALEAAVLRSVPLPVEARRIRVSVAVAAPNGDVALVLPPPVVLVSSPAAEAPGGEGDQGGSPNGALRWTLLRRRIGDRALAFPVVLSAGIARGAHALGRAAAELGAYLEGELGTAPPWIDVVAYGSAGLASRAYLAGLGRLPPIRKLALLGTPNLGTVRGHLEARAELAGHPLRLPGDGAGPALEELVFSGGAEQTLEFLALFNQRVDATRGAEVHLVAGTGGLDLLDPVLGCPSHDDRVCEESALGGVPGAKAHRVAENHETLGKGASSIALLAGPILGLEGTGGGEGGGVGPAGELADGAGGGAGAFDPSFPPGDIYSGVLEPGAGGALPLVSDTSESIIIILNSDLPGGIRFDVLTPGGERIDPPAAGARADVEYQTYGDGEGHEVQAYKFGPAAIGAYVALLENPVDNVPIQYTVEAYIESDLALAAAVEPGEVELAGQATIAAALTKSGRPETGATVEARVWRPDGSLEILALLDDGAEPDATAADGVYTARVSSAAQPGIHEVEVAAEEDAGAIALYRRETTTRFQVKSDAAAFSGGFSSGADDDDSDGVMESLWVEGGLAVSAPGVFLVKAKLTDSQGSPVAEGGSLFGVAEPDAVRFRVYFSGSDIYAARKSGPFVLSEVEVLDGSAGFVEADRRANALTIAEYDWADFGLAAGPNFKRGDANGDGAADISDAVTILEYLFTGTQGLPCLDAADANVDGGVDMSDAIYLLAYLFSGGPKPEAPFPGCGPADPATAQGCETYPRCP
ncbi:MAG: hypothetical protein HY721_35370, partial [Planctomycetes bacterium]|nr:hypothetical protein [Planctomycetota bacterium]